MTTPTTPSLEVPLLPEAEEEESRRPAPVPPLLRPKKGSSSSCFLADGILDDGDANGEISERSGTGGAGSASTSEAATAAAAASARELARATHTKTQKRLAFAVALASGFMVAEVIGGALANSLAIMSDAAHLLSDVAGMVS